MFFFSSSLLLSTRCTSVSNLLLQARWARCLGEIEQASHHKRLPVGAKDEVSVGKPRGHHEADQLKQVTEQGELVDAIHQGRCSPDGHKGGQADGNHGGLLLGGLPLGLWWLMTRNR